MEEIQKVTGHKSISALKKELGELYMIEMYPYTPSDCVEIDFDGENVKIKLPVALNQNFPLTPAEWSLLRDLVQKNKSTFGDLPAIDSILQKINSVIPSGDWSPFEETKSKIVKCIQNREILNLLYWKRSGQESEVRKVAPWILWEEDDSYLLGYDLEKKNFRAFRVDCILKIENSMETFSDLPDSAGEWLTGFKQLFSSESKESETAVLWVKESAAYHLSQKMNLKKTEFQKKIQDDMYYKFLTPIKEENWFFQTILGYGSSILVESPSILCDRIKDHLNSISFSKN